MIYTVSLQISQCINEFSNSFQCDCFEHLNSNNQRHNSQNLYFLVSLPVREKYS